MWLKSKGNMKVRHAATSNIYSCLNLDVSMLNTECLSLPHFCFCVYTEIMVPQDLVEAHLKYLLPSLLTPAVSLL